MNNKGKLVLQLNAEHSVYSTFGFVDWSDTCKRYILFDNSIIQNICILKNVLKSIAKYLSWQKLTFINSKSRRWIKIWNCIVFYYISNYYIMKKETKFQNWITEVNFNKANILWSNYFLLENIITFKQIHEI